MSETLTIRNFGPIQKAEIEIRDLTIFVGPQATGKSLAAQALYFLRGIEELLLPEVGTAQDELDAVLSTMEWWFGNPPITYTDSVTQLSWKFTELSNREIVNEICWDEDNTYLSEALKQRVSPWLERTEKASLQNDFEQKQYSELKQIYIPAGRALYSFLPPHSRFYSRLAQKWPGYILTFYETLGTAVTKLWQWQVRGLLQLSPSPTKTFLQERINTIIKGQIQYGPDTLLLEMGQKRLFPATIAAGQMEVWPFWAIIENGYRDIKRFTFEEPEAHLHPRAQRSVMEMIAYLTQQQTQFLLTTHSPYILYAVNNFLMAQKVLDAGQSLPVDVPPEVALRPDQVAAYRFAADGTVQDIMDAEVGLIDEHELDQVADDLGSLFADLQDRLAGSP